MWPRVRGEAIHPGGEVEQDRSIDLWASSDDEAHGTHADLPTCTACGFCKESLGEVLRHIARARAGWWARAWASLPLMRAGVPAETTQLILRLADV